MIPSETEIAWAAGIFEGEGCFSVSRRHTRVYLKLAIRMTDEDVIAKWAKLFDLSYRPSSRAKAHWKDIYTVEAVGSNALHVAAILEPHLGLRRTARLAEIREMNLRTKPRSRDCTCCGKRFNPTMLKAQRFCSTKCGDQAKYLRRKWGTESQLEARARGFGALTGHESSSPQPCPQCGETFLPNIVRRQRFCSAKCRDRHAYDKSRALAVTSDPA